MNRLINYTSQTCKPPLWISTTAARFTIIRASQLQQFCGSSNLVDCGKSAICTVLLVFRCLRLIERHPGSISELSNSARSDASTFPIFIRTLVAWASSSRLLSQYFVVSPFSIGLKKKYLFVLICPGVFYISRFARVLRFHFLSFYFFE